MAGKKPWVSGGVIGVAAGLLAAIVMSYLDWRKNPSGIFHNEAGTNWGFVFETAVSWFVPVALIASVLSITVLVFYSRR